MTGVSAVSTGSGYAPSTIRPDLVPAAPHRKSLAFSSDAIVRLSGSIFDASRFTTPS